LALGFRRRAGVISPARGRKTSVSRWVELVETSVSKWVELVETS